MRKSDLIKTSAFAALLLAGACDLAGGDKAKAPTEATSPSAAAPAAAGTSALTITPVGAVTPGQAATLTLTAMGPDGKPADAKEELHVMIVDAGFEDFVHTSAKPSGQPGQWTLTTTPKFARVYTVYAEVGGHGHAAAKEEAHDESKAHAHDEEKKGDHGAPPVSATFSAGTETAPAFASAQSLTSEVDGLVFNLSLSGPVKVGGHSGLTITVQDKATGQPFAALEPNFSRFGHLLAFATDGSGTMSEGHVISGVDAPDAAGRGGPVLGYELDVSKAGPMRLFLQVQRGGKVLAVPFTLVATQ